MITENIEGLPRHYRVNIKNLVSKYFDNSYKFKLLFEARIERYTLQYLPELPMYFYFYLENKSGAGPNHHLTYKANANYNENGEIIKNRDEQIGEPSVLLTDLERWLSHIKNEEGLRLIDLQIFTGRDEIGENEKIKSSDKYFSQEELNILNKKVNQIHVDLYDLSGLTLEAIEEIKNLLNDLIKSAPSQTKNDFQDNVIIKIYRKMKENAENLVYKEILKKTAKEIMDIFRNSIYNQISEGLNQMLIE